jgi:hypothetical protein
MIPQGTILAHHACAHGDYSVVRDRDGRLVYRAQNGFGTQQIVVQIERRMTVAQAVLQGDGWLAPLERLRLAGILARQLPAPLGTRPRLE